MRKIAYILSLSLLLAACSGEAIFYTLENEEKIQDTNNFNSNTPVLDFMIFDNGGTDYYIANGRQLWYSEAGASGTDNPWSAVSLNGFSGSETVPSMAGFNGKLYFTVSDEDSNSANVLYSLDSITGSPEELFRYNRTDVSGDDYHFHNLYVYSISGVGLYVSKVERSWSVDSNDSSSMVETKLYYYPLANIGELDDGLDDGRLVTLPVMDSNAYMIKGIISAETSIFLILNQSSDDVDSYQAGKLLSASTGAPTSFSIENVNGGTDYSFNNIYYSEAFDMLFISTRGNSTNPIFYKAWGGSWGSWTIFNDGDDDFQFSAFTDLPSSTQANTVLVGTRGDVEEGSSIYYSGSGYYELIISGQTISKYQDNNFADDNNYDSSDLESATITAFSYDTDRSKLYCATYDNGLWQNRWDSGDSDWTWYQE